MIAGAITNGSHAATAAAALSSLQSSAPIWFPSRPCGVRLDSSQTSRRLHVLAMALKRSPKRLKYSTPRFTKVFAVLFSLTTFGVLISGSCWEVIQQGLKFGN